MLYYACFYFSRKYTARLQEQEEHIETLIVKINNLEKQKSRLQSEVEVLIIDLEKVPNLDTVDAEASNHNHVNTNMISRFFGGLMEY